MFKHEVRESKEVIQATDYYSADIEGYSVIFTHDPREGGKLSIYPETREKGIRLGIIECRPDDVESLERFALDAPKLFTAIATELRTLGKSDLRSEHEITMDNMRVQFRKLA